MKDEKYAATKSKRSLFLCPTWGSCGQRFSLRTLSSRSWTQIPDNATAHARGYLAIRPPNTQRKCMAEIKQNKIEQVLAYREQVSLISFFSSTNVTGPAFHRCLFSKLGSYNALYYRGLKSNICIPNGF